MLWVYLTARDCFISVIMSFRLASMSCSQGCCTLLFPWTRGLHSAQHLDLSSFHAGHLCYFNQWMSHLSTTDGVSMFRYPLKKSSSVIWPLGRKKKKKKEALTWLFLFVTPEAFTFSLGFWSNSCGTFSLFWIWLILPQNGSFLGKHSPTPPLPLNPNTPESIHLQSGTHPDFKGAI